MARRKKKKNDLVQCFYARERLHGHTICNDELQICGGLLINKINFKIASQEKLIVFSPDLANVFDRLYHKGGLGFEDEKNMDLKTKDNVHIISG